MSARDVIKHALRVYYADSAEPNAIARELLAQRDAEHRAEVITAVAEEAARRLSVGKSRTVSKDAVLRFLRLEASVARVSATREKSSPIEADATPDFFQPGHTYRSVHTPYTAPELIITFRVEHITRHPDRGHRRAIGWMRSGEPGAKWHGDFRDEHEFRGWTDVTEGGERR